MWQLVMHLDVCVDGADRDAIFVEQRDHLQFITGHCQCKKTTPFESVVPAHTPQNAVCGWVLYSTLAGTDQARPRNITRLE